MNLPWLKVNRKGEREPRLNTNAEARSTSVSDDLAMIPWWSVLLAVLAFAGMQYFWNVLMPRPHHDFGPCACSWATHGAHWSQATSCSSAMSAATSSAATCSPRSGCSSSSSCPVASVLSCTFSCASPCSRAVHTAPRRSPPAVTSAPSASSRWLPSAVAAIAA